MFALSGEKKRRSLLAALITFAISSLAASLVFPILTPLFLSPEHSLLAIDASDSTRAIFLGLFLASFPLAQFLFSPLAGEYSDWKGRKPVYLITTFLEVIGYVLSALAIRFESLFLLFIGRIVTGIAAGNMTVCLASLVDLSKSDREKVRYFSAGSAVAGVMFVLGPFIGGKLSDSNIVSFFSYSFPMWAGAFFAGINFFVLLFLFEESLKEKQLACFDPIKAVHNIQLAFRVEQVRSLYLVYFLFLFAWNMFYQFIPAVIVKTFKASSSVIGDMSALMGIIWIVGTLSLVVLRRFTNPCLKKFLLWFILLFSFLCILIPFCTTIPSFLVVTGIAVFFAGSMWPIFTGAISKAADQSVQGKILGISQSVQSLAMMLAPFLGGFFVDLSKVPFVAGSVAALLAALFLTKARKHLFEL